MLADGDSYSTIDRDGPGMPIVRVTLRFPIFNM
jgi:hypothetical protein